MGIKYQEHHDYKLGVKHLQYIDRVLTHDLAKSGIQSAILVDMAGNIISKYDNGSCGFDLNLFAALASANYAAVDSMAQLIGEKEFSLMFHKGNIANTHFSKITNDLILIATFGSEISIGTLRQKIEDATKKIKMIWKLKGVKPIKQNVAQVSTA